VDQACVIQVVRVSGTIRKAEEEAIRRAKAAILRATAQGKTSDFSLDKMLGAEGAINMTRAGASIGIESDDDDDDMDED
jgi:ribonuclease P/MRP protein subunit POP5